jgi:hypothetical protein
MSLTKTVVALIEENGPSTPDDLMAELPECTRRQVMQALHNARFQGLLDVSRGKGLGVAKGSSPGVYSIGTGPLRVRAKRKDGSRVIEIRPREPVVKSRPRVSSVWQLGCLAEAA